MFRASFLLVCGQWAVPNLLLPLEPLLLLTTSLPEPSLTRSRQPSRSHISWWLLILGLTTSLPQRHLRLTCQPLLSVTQTLLRAMWTLSSSQQQESPVGLTCYVMTGEVLCGSSCLIHFDRDPQEIEKEEQAAAEKATTEEEFPVDGYRAQVADGPESTQVASVPIQQSPTEDQSHWPATEDCSQLPLLRPLTGSFRHDPSPWQQRAGPSVPGPPNHSSHRGEKQRAGPRHACRGTAHALPPELERNLVSPPPFSGPPLLSCRSDIRDVFLRLQYRGAIPMVEVLGKHLGTRQPLRCFMGKHLLWLWNEARNIGKSSMWPEHGVQRTKGKGMGLEGEIIKGLTNHEGKLTLTLVSKSQAWEASGGALASMKIK
ncbi:hypothetical protein GH733_015287, partial [Mirounga leonina]